MAGINQIEFDQVFITWYKPLRNFVYYKTGDMQAAEDIVQDTFLKVWERRETINTLTIKSLLYKIANNLFLNRIEHEKVTFNFVAEHQGDYLSNAPDFEFEMMEFDKRLQDSLAELNEKNREVFLMNRIDELSYAQIAENLGISVKAVEKRISKAMAFLKVRLNMKL